VLVQNSKTSGLILKAGYFAGEWAIPLCTQHKDRGGVSTWKFADCVATYASYAS
jgi:hypothetical protein